MLYPMTSPFPFRTFARWQEDFAWNSVRLFRNSEKHTAMAFVSAFPSTGRASQRRVCRRRPCTVASAGSDSGTPSVNSPNYELLGSGFQGKGLQTIEFRIRQNGTVEEKVTGVRGPDCQKVSFHLPYPAGKTLGSNRIRPYNKRFAY